MEEHLLSDILRERKMRERFTNTFAVLVVLSVSSMMYTNEALAKNAYLSKSIAVTQGGTFYTVNPTNDYLITYQDGESTLYAIYIDFHYLGHRNRSISSLQKQHCTKAAEKTTAMTSRRPAQAIVVLKALIEGYLQEGCPPPLSAIAQSQKINESVVRRCMLQLKRDGYVRQPWARGPYVPIRSADNQPLSLHLSLAETRKGYGR